MKLATYLQLALERLEVSAVFGIPGDFVLPLFEAIERDALLPLHYLSHEPSAVFAADAAARLTNRPSAVILTYGAGALNGVNAIAQAYVEHVPLIVIAGFPARAEIARNLLIHHQAKAVDSQRDIFREITACQVRLDRPETAASDIQRALQTALDYSQPVLIEVPRDAVQFELNGPLPTLGRQAQQAVEGDLVQRLQARISQARRPVILAGVDVRRFDATAALEHYARKTQTPMISTLMGRACLDPAHPCYAGIFLDKTDTQPAALLAEADLILMVGVIKNDSNFAANEQLFPAENVIEINENRLAWADQTHANHSLSALLTALANTANSRTQALPLRPAATPPCPPDQAPLTPSHVVETLHQALSDQPETLPLISDVGDCLFASLAANPRYLLAPAFYASMGYAVPAAFGVYAATGLRPVVLVGDGAFQMTGLELGHCRRYGCAPIVVLFNNQRWDMIRAFSPQLASTALDGWHYAQLANAMGGLGLTASTVAELKTCLAQALAHTTGFTLIDAQLARSSRTERLAGFAQGFLQAQKAPSC